MKLKQIKPMQFTELINYCWNNNIYEAEFKSCICNESVVKIVGGKVVTRGVEDQDVFEICVCDDITEESYIPKIIRFRKSLEQGVRIDMFENCQISQLKSKQTIAFYSLNNNMTMTLIWEKGELID